MYRVTLLSFKAVVVTETAQDISEFLKEIYSNNIVSQCPMPKCMHSQVQARDWDVAVLIYLLIISSREVTLFGFKWNITPNFSGGLPKVLKPQFVL